MIHGENTVCILYKIKNGKNDSKLTVTPIVNYRDFHQMSTDRIFKLRQEIKERKVKVVIDDNGAFPIYFNITDGKYTEHYNDQFNNMHYIEEDKRGFYPEENHAVPGTYEIELESNEEKEISFVCSLEENIDEISTKDIINKEIVRINELMLNSGMVEVENKQTKKQMEFIKDYIIATDNFVVYRPNFRLHTLIAGYPWFLDWGRDALISFEGLLLKTKRFEIAKEVLLTFVKNIKFGLVPNGYSGYDNRPLYNSADASLLLFEQIRKYLDYTNDIEFVKERLYEKLEEIIHSYINGIDLDDNNIYVDEEDGLLVSGTETTQNTWMDAKYGDYAVTPRNGKAVEMNSLWYNALKIMEDITRELKGTKQASFYKKQAEKCKKSFEEKFYNKRRKCLYDVLGDSKIRPNQLFALSLSHPIINPSSEEAENIINMVEKKLLNKYGLKTLAKGEENYIEVYEGDSFKRDMSYHQGITWPWLLGLYFDSLKNIINAKKTKTKKKEYEQRLKEFKQNVKETFKHEFYEEGMLGSISELHDSKSPFLPKGALAQGWSVSEVFRIILD